MIQPLPLSPQAHYKMKDEKLDDLILTEIKRIQDMKELYVDQKVLLIEHEIQKWKIKPPLKDKPKQ